MDRNLRSLIAGFILLLAAVNTNKASANPDCGSSISQVIEIMDKKFPGSDHTWVNNFVGRWLSDGERVSIDPRGAIVLKGYRLQFCPMNGNRFRVLANGSDIGSLSLKGRNTIEVVGSWIGQVFLDREGSVAARRRQGKE